MPTKKKGPGQHHRKGLSLAELIRQFPDNDAAESWFCRGALARWPPVSALRIRQHPDRRSTQDAVSLSRLSQTL